MKKGIVRQVIGTFIVLVSVVVFWGGNLPLGAQDIFSDDFEDGNVDGWITIGHLYYTCQ